MASIHAEVPSDVDIETSHEIIDRVERDAVRKLHLFLVIHMDPLRQKNAKVDNYRKIVIADDSEQDEKYKSDYRGRVQDRNVSIKMEPMYALTYYEKLSEVKRIVHFHKYIEELNHSKLFPKPLRITNMEAPLTEEQVRFHFALIDAHTSDVVADEKNAKKRFMRGLDFYLVQDFASSIDDFTKSILLDDTSFRHTLCVLWCVISNWNIKRPKPTMQ